MNNALLAARLFAVDPAGTGVVLRAGAGPARDEWLAALRGMVPEGPWRRLPTGISDDRLLGGLDLAGTLAAGRPVAMRGVLAEADGGVVLLPMAERLPAGTVARLTAVLDGGAVAAPDGPAATQFGVVALDEGIEDEQAAPSLKDRLAFHVELLLPLPPGEGRGEGSRRARSIAPALTPHPDPIPGGEGEARLLLPLVTAGDDIVEALCATALALGVVSIRAPLLALRVARAAAALDGRVIVSMDDAALAARLVLAPRATQVPSDADAPAPDQPPDQPDTPPDQPDNTTETDAAEQPPPGDIVLDAARAAIPAGLLAQLQTDGPRVRKPAAGKAGTLQSGQRGRPAGVRAGDPRGGVRLNVIETLRAAAPWQRIRAAQPGRLQIRRDDFRITRLKQRSETTTIFLVDASGSSALNRLAEAKGAVELLLADCYIRRDQVAVMAFRGRAAELLLPPTRSLVRAKRSLAGLPGGGGTPLAAGINAGALLADQVRRRGGTPTLVLLTDGRANVGLDGRGGRARAEDEAMDAARAVRAARFAALFVDTSPRPNPVSQRIAAAMSARYVPLPYADARALSDAVRTAAA